jgi:hypothetical protein
VSDYFDDPGQARRDGARGLEVIAQSRGAVDRLVEMVLPLLSPQAKDASASASSAS